MVSTGEGGRESFCYSRVLDIVVYNGNVRLPQVLWEVWFQL